MDLTQQFPEWKRIVLGLHKSPEEYRAAIRAAGRRIGGESKFESVGASDMLDSIIVSPHQVEVSLVKLSLRKLGSNDVANYLDFCQKAIDRGFELCPAEVGPALRLQHEEQLGERFNLGMELIPQPWQGSNAYFVVSTDEDRYEINGGENIRWLGEFYDRDRLYDLDYEMLFIRPK